MAKFKELKVYSKALELVDMVYELAPKFPKEELFALTSQFKTSATSICLNIAECSGIRDVKESIKHLQIAHRASFELNAVVDIAMRLNFISADDHHKLTARGTLVSEMLKKEIEILSKKK